MRATWNCSCGGKNRLLPAAKEISSKERSDANDVPLNVDGGLRPPGLAQMRGPAEGDFGAFHDRLREGRVRVNALGHVAGYGGHLHGQHALANQFAGPSAD